MSSADIHVRGQRFHGSHYSLPDDVDTSDLVDSLAMEYCFQKNVFEKIDPSMKPYNVSHCMVEAIFGVLAEARYIYVLQYAHDINTSCSSALISLDEVNYAAAADSI